VADGVTGRLVPPHDEPAMAAALVQLLGDRERRDAMGEAGRARVEAAFSIERMVEKTLEVYERRLR
jgi:D-inositol-3-phosphate glycosyltransferase